MKKTFHALFVTNKFQKLILILKDNLNSYFTDSILAKLQTVAFIGFFGICYFYIDFCGTYITKTLEYF